MCEEFILEQEEDEILEFFSKKNYNVLLSLDKLKSGMKVFSIPTNVLKKTEEVYLNFFKEGESEI